MGDYFNPKIDDIDLCNQQLGSERKAYHLSVERIQDLENAKKLVERKSIDKSHAVAQLNLSLDQWKHRYWAYEKKATERQKESITIMCNNERTFDKMATLCKALLSENSAPNKAVDFNNYMKEYKRGTGRKTLLVGGSEPVVLKRPRWIDFSEECDSVIGHGSAGKRPYTLKTGETVGGERAKDARRHLIPTRPPTLQASGAQLPSTSAANHVPKAPTRTVPPNKSTGSAQPNTTAAQSPPEQDDW